MRQNGALLWLFGDHLGSTSKVANGDGSLNSEQLYKPWGEKRWPTGAPTLPTTFRYTGQRSETGLGPSGGEGLYFYNSRYYDPLLGRFTSPDSIIPEQSQGVQAWDRYAYLRHEVAISIVLPRQDLPFHRQYPTGTWETGNGLL
jgi:RHS repeat-associated protein